MIFNCFATKYKSRIYCMNIHTALFNIITMTTTSICHKSSPYEWVCTCMRPTKRQSFPFEGSLDAGNPSSKTCWSSMWLLTSLLLAYQTAVALKYQNYYLGFQLCLITCWDCYGFHALKESPNPLCRCWSASLHQWREAKTQSCPLLNDLRYKG